MGLAITAIKPNRIADHDHHQHQVNVCATATPQASTAFALLVQGMPDQCRTQGLRNKAYLESIAQGSQPLSLATNAQSNNSSNLAHAITAGTHLLSMLLTLLVVSMSPD